MIRLSDLRHAIALLILSALPAAFSADDAPDSRTVGVQADGRIIVPTSQILSPAGKQITFPGRPVDLAFTPGEKTLIVKGNKDLFFIDTTGALKQTLTSATGFSVVGLAVDGDTIYCSDCKGHVRVAVKHEDGTFAWTDPIAMSKPEVGGDPHPAGLALGSAPTGTAGSLFVASTRGNSIQRVDLKTKKVTEDIPVGVAPFAVIIARKGKIYVSNWGGDRPAATDPSATTSLTPAKIDPATGVVNEGSVSVLTLGGDKWKQTKTIRTGLHSSGMVLDPAGKYLYVANANSDTVSVIDTEKDSVTETISCRPESSLPFGSGSNALALSHDGKSLYVANGTNNCIAILELASKKVAGLIPAGWYPGAIQVSADGNTIYVANIKGHGSLSQPRAAAKGKTTRDYLGSLSIINVPDAAQLAKYTSVVNANNRMAYSLAGLEAPRAGAKPIPLPERHGEPSPIKHVLFIIKENRTYDQVFGDMKEGNGDPALTIFGEDVTPNQHALARQFTLFDNFYCSGVLSADGHHWINSAYVTDYLERAFGGFTRSYPYTGDDPLASASSGFIWKLALDHKKTFRDYGEFTDNNPYVDKKAPWADYYKDYVNNTSLMKIAAHTSIKILEPYIHKGYPSFPLQCPDVYRAKLFIDDLKAFEKKGEFPDLIMMSLPCNHTTGTKPLFPTPRASAADNDLALGQIVDAVTHSKFWAETCIFVVEDDPQAGFDHVDAHRTCALVISPYTKRNYADHANYNQIGMVKSIELMLGLPPMNQMDLAATPMRHCFQTTADLSAFTVLPNKIPLDELNKPLGELKGKAAMWAKKSMDLDFTEVDKADEDTLNRILWHSTRGVDTPFPEHFAGVDDDDDND